MTRPARGSGARSTPSPGVRAGVRKGTGPAAARPEARRRTTTTGRRTVPLADEAASRPAPADDDPPGGGTRPPLSPGVRRRFTGRAAVLLAVLVLLIVGLAYPLREYVSQRQQIAALERTQQRQAKDITALQRQQARWQDPAYVEQQARVRLHYARPGEITYVVVGDTKGHGGKGGVGATGGGPNWSDRLWTSVRVADHPGP